MLALESLLVLDVLFMHAQTIRRLVYLYRRARWDASMTGVLSKVSRASDRESARAVRCACMRAAVRAFVKKARVRVCASWPGTVPAATKSASFSTSKR
eukprot:3185108-Pleurochrysis_carterae.AAC.2